MRATAALLRQNVRLTLFTRRNCPLCDEAKEVMDKVKQRRPFEYNEVNVMGRGQKQWKDLYEFETPVVRIVPIMFAVSHPLLTTAWVHVDAAEEGDARFETTAEARKLMHRFTETQLEEAMDSTLEPTK